MPKVLVDLVTSTWTRWRLGSRRVVCLVSNLLPEGEVDIYNFTNILSERRHICPLVRQCVNLFSYTFSHTEGR